MCAMQEKGTRKRVILHTYPYHNQTVAHDYRDVEVADNPILPMMG